MSGRRVDATKRRLSVAVIASLIVHLMVLRSLPTQAPNGVAVPDSPIEARLDYARDEAQTSVLSPPVALEPSKAAAATTKLDDPITQPPRSQAAAPATPATQSGQQAALPPAADPTYYPARQLDVYPQLVGRERLAPLQTAVTWVGGRLLILLLVDELGIVNDISIVEADPAGRFEDVVYEVFRSAYFTPGMKDGRAVKSRVLIQVVYNPAGDEGELR